MRRVGFVLLLCLGAGCATLQTPRSDELEQEVATLESELLEARRRAVMAEVELERLQQQLAELGAGAPPVPESTAGASGPPPEETVASATGSGATDAASRQGVPESVVVEAPSGEEPEVAGSADEAEGADAANGIQSSDLEMATVEVESPADDSREGATGPEDAAPPTGSEARATAAPRPVDAAGQTLYDEGYTAYHQERFADAESRFGTFLERYERTELADNALYWIGQARLQRGDVQGALEAFRGTVERYPEGNKVPEALLSAGGCLESLDRADRAQVTYRELAERFPNTAAAEIAKERLSALE